MQDQKLFLLGELVNLRMGQQLKVSVHCIRGANLRQIRIFFEHCSKGGGGGQTHVQKICCKFCMIIKAFWQHKIDIKRLFKGRNVSIWG